jgi:tRNA threonylcarbamoyladenosine biosynthesis protein TsaB
MNLLALETATDVCSTALLHDQRVEVSLSIYRPRAHAEHIVSMIRRTLQYAGRERSDLDGVAVSMGPGSYTGLRIGVSTAKGLALALGIPLIGVPSLEALAASVAAFAGPGELICASFAARRQEVFAAAFRRTEEEALVPSSPTSALTSGEVVPWLHPREGDVVWLAGDGSESVARALEPVRGLRVRMARGEAAAPSAAGVGRLAWPRFESGAVHDLASFEPFYLKEFMIGRALTDRADPA